MAFTSSIGAISSWRKLTKKQPAYLLSLELAGVDYSGTFHDTWNSQTVRVLSQVSVDAQLDDEAGTRLYHHFDLLDALVPF